MKAYALKAVREAKQETSWTNVNEPYEAALQEFVGKLLDEKLSSRFLVSFKKFAVRTSLLGALNSLSQLALKALLPGVPDFYQGTEVWDLAFVDPDNRRPIDFDLRRHALGEDADFSRLAAHWHDGGIKLALTRQLLRLRLRYPDLFQRGSYEPLTVDGPQAEHVIAFSRSFKHERLIVAVCRHFASLTNGGRQWPSGWDGVVKAPSGRYEPLIGGDRVPIDGLKLAALFQYLPVNALRKV